MDHPCDKYIERALTLAAELLILADNGDQDRDDDGCGILFGVLRDSAYKIRKLAQCERVAHHSRRQETTSQKGRDVASSSGA